MICPPVCGLTEPTHHSLTAGPWSSWGFRKARHQSLLQSAQPNIPWGSVPSGRGLRGSKGGALYRSVTGIAGQKPFAIRVSLILSRYFLSTTGIPQVTPTGGHLLLSHSSAPIISLPFSPVLPCTRKSQAPHFLHSLLLLSPSPAPHPHCELMGEGL